MPQKWGIFRMKPSPSQKNALDEVLSFLLSDEKCMVIDGAAGTGKSFTLAQVIEHLPEFQKVAKVAGFENYPKIRIAAPTNKAVENLKEMVSNLPAEVQATVDSYQTLHRLFNIPVDFKTNRSLYNKASTVKDSILLIDEMPMIETGMEETIVKKTENCKIIYFGDGNQLPPVNEPPQPDGTVLIPVLQQGYRHATLTDQMRQKSDGELYEFISKICDGVKTASPIDASILQANSGVSFLDEVGVKSMFDALFDPQSQYLNLVVLAYTNKCVNKWEADAREYLKLPIIPAVGSTVNTHHGVGKVSAITHNTYTFTAPVTNEIVDIEYYDYAYKAKGVVHGGTKLVNQIKANKYLKYMQKHREKLNKESSMNLFGAVSPAERDAEIKATQVIEQRLNVLMQQHRDATLDTTIAMTVHKAQGSTYDYVFIDMENFTENAKYMSVDTLKRLLYVAVSRAKEHVVFYGNFPAKLF